ncbi:MAG: PD40 domain-containing protein [Halioglobus sp.]|nr:PD40 domain-containing protein [Halioglobus sp.]
MIISGMKKIACMLSIASVLSACGGGGGGSGSDIPDTNNPGQLSCLSNFAEGANDWAEYEDNRGSLIFASNQFKTLNRYDFGTDQFQFIGGTTTDPGLIDVSPSSTGRYVRYGIDPPFTSRSTYTTVDVTNSQEYTTGAISLVGDFIWAPDDQSSFMDVMFFKLFRIGSPVAPPEDTIARQFLDIRVVSWTSDGSQALLVGDQQLIVISARSGEVLRQIQPSFDDGSFIVGHAALSPDGSKVAFVESTRSDRSIYVLDIATGTISRISSMNGQLAWSPSSKYIAFDFYNNDQHNSDLKLYTLATETLDTLSDTNRGLLAFEWAPDKDLLAYSEQPAGGQGKFTMRNYQDDSASTTPIDRTVTSFKWSPDSRYVAFMSSDADRNRNLFVGDPVNRCAMSLDNVYTSGQSTRPDAFSWSPSGKYLYYSVADNSGSVEHIVTTANGAEVTNITPLITDENMSTQTGRPQWLPTADVLFSIQNSESSNATVDGFIWLNINSLTSISFNIDDPGRPASGQGTYWLRP